jgi:acyl carrier protein
VNQPEVVESIEQFVRAQFSISPSDPRFGRDVDLFEGGYVDSVGLAELLAFIEAEFGVSVPDDDLLSEEFATIDGMARTVGRLGDR